MDDSKNINEIDYNVLVEEQTLKINTIQDKLLQIDLDNPLHDVFEALYLELGRSISEIAELKKMQEELERNRKEKEAQQKEAERQRKEKEAQQKEVERQKKEKEAQQKEAERQREEKEAQQKEVERQRKEKEAQQKEVERYREEKDNLVSLLQFRDFENIELQKNLKRLSCWLDILHKDISVLLSSRRWKVGNTIVNLAYKLTFRKERDAKISRIEDVISQFEVWKENSKNITPKEKGLSKQNQDIKKLACWMNQLQKHIPHLLISRRMKAGNLVVNALLTPLGRGKNPIQFTNIENIFNDYNNLHPRHSEKDIKDLSKLIANLETNYVSLINSRRWKVGHFIVSSLNLLLLRNKKNVVAEAIEEIFADFNKWKEGKRY